MKTTTKLRHHIPFGKLMPLALVSVSHDANTINNGTIAFLRVKITEIKQIFCHVMPFVLPSVSHTANDVINGPTVHEVQHDFFVQ